MSVPIWLYFWSRLFHQIYEAIRIANTANGIDTAIATVTATESPALGCGEEVEERVSKLVCDGTTSVDW